MANGPTDELLKRLLAAVSAHASGELVDRLIADGRAEAEAEVKALVKAAYKASLLRAATEAIEPLPDPDHGSPHPPAEEAAPTTPQPVEAAYAAPARIDRLTEVASEESASAQGENSPPRAQAIGCYVYALTAAGPHDWITNLRGVDARCPLEVVTHDDVQAVVSAVSMEEFGQATLGEHVSDPRWVEEKVRAHDQVVRGAMSAGPVIPCRFSMLVRGVDHVRRLLAERRDDVAAALATLGGKQEWGVKVYANLTALSRQLEEGDTAAAADGTASGKNYLRRKQRADTTRGDAERLARAHADECHIALAAIATDATQIPRRPRSNANGRAGVEPILNGAYLVAERNLQRFHDVIAALSDRFYERGITFEVTGPWPPYNFVKLDLSPRQAVA
jgi:hypothetical protein